MPDYIAKVAEPGGGIMSPITITSASDKRAEEVIREQPFIDEGSSITIKEVRTDVMQAAFGFQQEDAVVIRADWVWMPSGEASPPV